VFVGGGAARAVKGISDDPNMSLQSRESSVVPLLGPCRYQREAGQELKPAHRDEHDDDRHTNWIANMPGSLTSITGSANRTRVSAWVASSSVVHGCMENRCKELRATANATICAFGRPCGPHARRDAAGQ
jgi:hypothetical protein